MIKPIVFAVISVTLLGGSIVRASNINNKYLENIESHAVTNKSVAWASSPDNIFQLYKLGAQPISDHNVSDIKLAYCVRGGGKSCAIQ